MGFGFLCSISSTNTFPSAFICKKCVEVFHLQKTFLPSFFSATDLFLSSLQHRHFSGISGNEANTHTSDPSSHTSHVLNPGMMFLKMNFLVKSLLMCYLYSSENSGDKNRILFRKKAEPKKEGRKKRGRKEGGRERGKEGERKNEKKSK